MMHPNWIPAVTIAVHLHRNLGGYVLVTSDYKPSTRTICVGLDTGIKTGLPFLITAPLLLNEWIGDALLEKYDDAAFKIYFPGTRNIVFHKKIMILPILVLT